MIGLDRQSSTLINEIGMLAGTDRVKNAKANVQALAVSPDGGGRGSPGRSGDVTFSLDTASAILRRWHAGCMLAPRSGRISKRPLYVPTPRVSVSRLGSEVTTGPG